MAMISRILVSLVVIASFLTFPNFLGAQQVQIPQQAFDGLATALKLSPSDPQFKALVSKLKQSMRSSIDGGSMAALQKFQGKEHERVSELRRTLPYVPAENFQEELSKVKIIKHFRSTNGIPIQPRRLPTEPTETEKQTVAEAQAQLLKGMMSSIEKLKTARVPACTEDRTERKALRKLKEGDSDASFEILFLRDAKPRDPDELFGAKVVVYTCMKDGIDSCVIPFHKYGLNCLPSRVKMTNKEIVLREGKTALMNYEKKKTGELHEATKAQLSNLME